jgi:hypothetical protein
MWRRLGHKFQDVIVPKLKIVHTTVGKFRETWSLLGKKGNKSKDRVLIELRLEIGARLGHWPEDLLDAVRRIWGIIVSGFNFQVCSTSEKKLQPVKVNVNVLEQCEEFVRITSAVNWVTFVCDMLIYGLIICAEVPNSRGKS